MQISSPEGYVNETSTSQNDFFYSFFFFLKILSKSKAKLTINFLSYISLQSDQLF